MTRGATPLGDVLKTVLSKIGGEKAPVREEVERFWAEVAGAAAAKHSRPIVLRRKILTVGVDSPSWIQELTLKKRGILRALKSRLGKDTISEIHFRIAEF